MDPKLTPPSSLISPAGYELLVSSDRLRQALLPDGLFTSPYEVLSYDSRVLIGDAKGRYAKFARRQKVRFLHDGPTAILDHIWGDGVLFEYRNSAGGVVDGACKHLVVELRRPMKKGETFAFETARTVLQAFTKPNEWAEVLVDHPVQKLCRSIAFPPERPCQQAQLTYEGRSFVLPVVLCTDGTTVVRFEIAQPKMNTSYRVCWSW